MRKAIFLTCLVVVLGSCKEDESNSLVGLTLTGDTSASARQGFPYSLKFEVAGGSGSYSYTLENQPLWMSFDRENATLSGTPTETATHQGIKFSVTDDTGTVTKEFDLEVVGDPFASEAWHLDNTGQRTFAVYPGIEDVDMNVIEVMKMGYSGKGVRVGVSDSGLDINHKDLKVNVNTSLNKDYGVLVANAAANPYGGDPTPRTNGGDHGTSVGGIVAAAGWNGIGSRGVAPDATVAGINFLGEHDSFFGEDNDQKFYFQLVGTYVDQARWLSDSLGYDVFNQSWGPGTLEFVMLDPIYYRQLILAATQYRSGKGAILVRSAGNNDTLPIRINNTWNSVGVSANVHEDNSHPFEIVVSALNASGQKSSYSSWGSNIWVTAPGGEFGANHPAILTTDLSGCDKGYSPDSKGNAFDKGDAGPTENTECDYTASFNGTSSAAPNVSGVVALMLEANPDLSFRDVKHILASTSRKIDSDIGVTTRQIMSGASTLFTVTVPDWTTNQAGFAFHEYYGFGLVDAQAAVNAALSYSFPLGTLKMTVNKTGNCPTEFCDNDTWIYEKSGLNTAIPEGSQITDTIPVANGDNLTIEAVQVELSVTHAEAQDLRVELVSPSGTVSQLLFPSIYTRISDYTEQNIVNQRVLSNAFYGESAAGDWTLRLSDDIPGAPGELGIPVKNEFGQTVIRTTNDNTPTTGTLTGWKINVIGH